MAKKQTTPAQQIAAYWRTRVYPFLERTYGLDLRSLALFRIAFALIYLGDLALRALDILPHYTDFGLLPRSALFDNFSNPAQFSIYFVSGNEFVIAMIMLAAAVPGLMMLAGFRAQLATFLCWFFTISIQNRNPPILQGGDVLFRMLLFWAMFLPLGAWWSFDAGLDTAPEKRPVRVFNWASAGLLLQVCALYWVAFLLKTGPEWHKEGNAVWYALNIQQMATPVGTLLIHFPRLLHFLTFFTLSVELVAPFFLLMPFLAGPWRMSAVLFLGFLQLSFGTCISLGHFPLIGSGMMLAMLPTFFWNALRREERKPPKPVRVYYDQDCSFCKRSVHIFKAMAFPAEAVLLPAQGTQEIHREMVEQKSWVVVDESGHHYKTGAMIALLGRTHIWRWLAWVLATPRVRPWADRLYEAIERGRPQLSRATELLKFRPLRYRLHPVVHVLVAACVLLTIVINISAKVPMDFPRPLWQVEQFLRLDQRWDMFSPSPLRDDGYYVIDGTLRDGRHVDVFRNGAPVDFSPRTRQQIAAQYPRERWRKYYMNFYLAGFENYRLWYGKYICRNWNSSLPDGDPRQLDTFDIDFFLRTNAPPGEPEPPYHELVTYHHYCFEKK